MAGTPMPDASLPPSLPSPPLHRLGGGASSGDDVAGTMSPFRLLTKFPPRIFLRNLGHFLLLVHTPGGRPGSVLVCDTPQPPPPPPRPRVLKDSGVGAMAPTLSHA